MQDKKVSAELNKVLGGPVAGSLTTSGIGQALAIAMPGTTGSDGGATGGATATAGQNALSSALTQNTAQLTQVHSTLQGQLDSLVANTQALIDNTSKSAGSKVANAATSVVSSVLGGGLLGSLFSGLTSIFGGGGSQAPAPLVKFALPAKVGYEGSLQGTTTGAVDYGQNGQPRSVQPSSPASPAPQVTVNISAMDSRSFLDRSSDIANAVRRAMLESSSLNDVIGDL